MEIRDRRTGRWFWMHAAVLDDYGPALGMAGLAVYMALCRRANERERAWPSIAGLARGIGCGQATVVRALEKLEGLGLITIEHRQSEAGDASSNVYTLLDPKRGGSSATEGRSSAGEVEVETVKKSPLSSVSSTKKPQKEVFAHFAAFWEAYPRKVAKGAAERAWRRVPDEVRPTLAGIVALHARQWDDRDFIPHASSWLNARRWEDDLDGVRAEVSASRARADAYAAAKRAAGAVP